MELDSLTDMVELIDDLRAGKVVWWITPERIQTLARGLGVPEADLAPWIAARANCKVERSADGFWRFDRVGRVA